MTNHERAQQLFAEAQGIAEELRSALDRRLWNLTLRRAQEGVELVVKGLLNEMGVEYPRTHDPAPLLAETVRGRRLEVDSAVLAERGVGQIGRDSGGRLLSRYRGQ